MRYRYSERILQFLVITVLILFLAGETYAKDEKSKAILILDASGSMWGRIEDKPKIDIAREVIREILGDWNPSVELGLMVYGHREKGNCDDIETLMDVGPVDAAKIIHMIDGLSPKGKTPLSRSVQQAAEQLQYTEEKATVILVSDGIETCHMDPCGVAKELEEKGIDFTTHVIGFDIEEGELDQLRCLAENTGGMFLSADSADELKSALNSAVQSVEKGPNVKLAAALKEDGEPLAEGISYTIYKAKPDQDGNYTQVASSNRSPAFFHLPAGSYHVVAQFGKAEATADIHVADDQLTDIKIVINAGKLRVKAVEVEGGEPLGSTDFRVYEAQADKEGNRKEVAGSYSSAKQASFNLPAGRYHVVARYDKAASSVDVEVKGGELTDVTIVLGSGELRLKAVEAEGGEPLGSTDFRVYEAQADKEGNRKEVAGSYSSAKQVSFNLPAGNYHVVAQYDKASSSVDVEVKGGELTDVTIVLGSGELRLKAVEAEGGEPLAPTNFKVYEAQADKEGNRKEVAGSYSSAKQASFNLPAGHYHVVARYDKAESSVDVAVKEGELTDVTIVLGSGSP